MPSRPSCVRLPKLDHCSNHLRMAGITKEDYRFACTAKPNDKICSRQASVLGKLLDLVIKPLTSLRSPRLTRVRAKAVD